MNLPDLINKPIRVIQVVHSLHPNGGGITKTVTQLSDGLAAIDGTNVDVLCQQSKDKLLATGSNRDVRYDEVQPSNALTARLSLGFNQALSRKLTDQDIPTVIHNNGLWLPINHWAVQAASRLNIPIVTQTHGMLEPWALEHNKFKKKIASWVYQNRDLARTNLLLATAETERENLRALGFSGPIAVIANGIEFPKTRPIQVETKDNDKSFRTVLFLSRIHKKKGLINLIHAWAAIRPEGWRLKIVGPDENNHREEVKRAAINTGTLNDIDFIDPIDGEEKDLVFRSADLFVLPTFSENFGVVVAEALSHGLPVITTRGAPWEDLEKFGCGWWIDVGVTPLIEALRSAMSMKSGDLKNMGVKGQCYVQKYDWTEICREMNDVYRWLLGYGPQPSSVSY